MYDPYRTQIKPEIKSTPRKKRPVWHYTGVGAYLCMWVIVLIMQSVNWSDWRPGTIFVIAIHGIFLLAYTGAKSHGQH